MNVQTSKTEIVWSDTLDQSTRYIIERSKGYETVILLYEDDLSGLPVAAWAEKDRLSLPTRYVGELASGLEVHSFGLPPFADGSVVELSLRAARQENGNQPNSQRTLYKSLLNELTLISVRIYASQFQSYLT